MPKMAKSLLLMPTAGPSPETLLREHDAAILALHAKVSDLLRALDRIGERLDRLEAER